ncbi:hypothetical protein TcCL_ESM04859 [Trypanosoma cruzi]|nr:hypothetical protein TcCL_ESM04859 [Trypanosoma cruzi]
MTVAVLSAHIHTLFLSLCGSDCSSSVVYGSGSWCLAENETPRNKRANLLDAITMADESCFVAFASYIAKNAPCRFLTGCLHLAPFEALRSFIYCDATIIMAASFLNGSDCDNTNDGK